MWRSESLLKISLLSLEYTIISKQYSYTLYIIVKHWCMTGLHLPVLSAIYIGEKHNDPWSHQPYTVNYEIMGLLHCWHHLHDPYTRNWPTKLTELLKASWSWCHPLVHTVVVWLATCTFRSLYAICVSADFMLIWTEFLLLFVYLYINICVKYAEFTEHKF